MAKRKYIPDSIYDEFEKTLFGLIDEGRWEEMVEFLKGYTKYTAESYVFVMLARACIALHDHKSALRYARRAVRIDPQFALNQYSLAWSLYSDGRYAEAIVVYEEIADGKYEGERFYIRDSWFWLAACHFKLGDYAKELECLKKHLAMRRRGAETEIPLTDVKAMIKESTLYLSKKIPKEMRREVDCRIDELRDAHRWQELVGYLNGLEKYEYDYFIFLYLSEACIELKDYDRALAYAEKTIRMGCGDDRLCLFRYGIALLHKGMLRKARRQFQAILDTDLNELAYNEHGEGMRYAKRLQADSRRYLEKCVKKQMARRIP